MKNLKIRNSILTGVAVSTLVAAFLWYIIFIVKPINFWACMFIGIILLFLTAVIFDRQLLNLGKPKIKHLLIGILSAAILYGIFFIGNNLSSYIIPSKDAQIESVYMNRNGTNPLLIFAVLMFVIGPGEEIFWRGFIQKKLTEKYGLKAVVIAAVLYAAVHVVTLNFMLVMAALVCGLFWGALYYREQSLYHVIVSHALWDVTVFLLLPFN